MHYEILVEDQSGKVALDILIPKIIGEGHTFRVIAYKGIGRVPPGMRGTADASKRILLSNLPKLLRGYGSAFGAYPPEYRAAVVLVCDLDSKNFDDFCDELNQVLGACNPKPETRFCIAIEEGEAWLLGDIAAIKAAYTKAKEAVLNAYKNDSICGTWEVLAEALYVGGAQALAKQGWQKVGAEKSVWAGRITPHMDVNMNRSPSFCYFRDQLLELANHREQA
jgi:hypothetical protein